MRPHDGTRSSAFRTLCFVVVILGGQVLLLPVLLTFLLARTVQRQPSLVSFCAAWVAFSVFASLLLYAGQIDHPDPPNALCLVQICGMLGSYILAGFAAICLSIQVYWATPNGDRPRPLRRFEPWLAYIPPGAWFLHQLIFIIIHFARKDGIVVERRDQLCVIEDPHKVTRITQLVAAACATASIGITVFMTVRAVGYLRAQNLSLRRLLLARGPRRAGNATWLRILVRLCVFEFYCIIVVLIVVVMAARRPPAIIRQTIDFIVDTVPLVTFLVFGTSNDILRAWGLRKPDFERTTTTTATATTSATLTRKDTLGSPPPVPPKDEAYSMGGIASPYAPGADWAAAPTPAPAPASASPVTPSSARSRLAPPPPLGTPTFYAEQTRRDPALCSSPGFAALHFAQSANQPLPPSATASSYSGLLPPSAAASVQSFASADPLVPAWRREWGEPVRRAPDADEERHTGYPPSRLSARLSFR